MNGMQVTLIGNVTAEPEVTFTAAGKSRIAFSVAVERNWRDQAGEWQKHTSFADVIAWGEVAEQTGNLIEKGMRVIVAGRFEQRSWLDEATGKNRYRWEVTADEVAVSTKAIESVVRRRRDDNTNTNGNGNGNARASSAPRPAARPAARNGGPFDSDEQMWG